jgi:hypothetical protein
MLGIVCRFEEMLLSLFIGAVFETRSKKTAITGDGWIETDLPTVREYWAARRWLGTETGVGHPESGVFSTEHGFFDPHARCGGDGGSRLPDRNVTG